MPVRQIPPTPSAGNPPGNQPVGSGPPNAAMAQLAWSALPQLLAVVDPDGRLGATNPSWQRLLGLQAADLRGRSLASLAHPDDQADARRWLRQVISGGGPAGFTGRWRDASGGHMRLQWTLALRDGLACAIGEPARDPAAPGAGVIAAQARQQTLRSVARLTSDLTHNFNNLLQVLRNTLELIQQRPGDPCQVAGWAGSALRIVDRGALLTGQLMSFAATEGLTPQTVDVAAVLRSLRGRLDGLLGPDITLRLDVPADGTLATGDASQLERAVLNLVLNAVDAMPRGGELAITVGRTHVEEDLELATGDYVALDVRDSGAGMSRTVRDRAFEPFFTTKAIGRGRGLGLSQVYGFAQAIGGTLRLEAPQASGNTVRLFMPAVAAPTPGTAISARAAAGADSAARQPRVLLVADDSARRDLLVSALHLMGYTDVEAADGCGAAQRIEERRPDVVVLGLPARPVSADELARRARRSRPDVSVGRLDGLARVPWEPLDLDALTQAIRRTVKPPSA